MYEHVMRTSLVGAQHACAQNKAQLLQRSVLRIVDVRARRALRGAGGGSESTRSNDAVHVQYIRSRLLGARTPFRHQATYKKTNDRKLLLLGFHERSNGMSYRFK